MKKAVLAALFAAFLSAPALAAEAPLTRADVEGIVRAYIKTHPQEILEAVQDHQEQTMRERQQGALDSNHADLYLDINTPVAGNENGAVTVVEFFDYNCGYCKKALPQIMKLLEEEKDVRVLFKEFPILGPSSELAAKWALAAHMQGKYFPFHQALMNNKAPVTGELLEKIAAETKLDMDRARRDAGGTEILVQIERNRSLAANMGLQGTPAFIVGDTVVPGALTLDALKKLIAEARADGAGAQEKKKE